MATTPESQHPPFDIREQIARIDKLIVEAGRIRQDIRIAPRAIVITALGAGAALFAARAAFMKLATG